MITQTDIENCRVVRKDDENGVRTSHSILGRLGSDGTTFGKLSSGTRRPIPHGHLMTSLNCSGSERAAHVAQSQDADPHEISLRLPYDLFARWFSACKFVTN